MRLPTMMRSRSTPSNTATFGSSPHRWNPNRRNNARLGSLWPNMKPNSVSTPNRSEEHTSELQSLAYLVCRLLLEKKNQKQGLAQHSKRVLPTQRIVPEALTSSCDGA